MLEHVFISSSPVTSEDVMCAVCFKCAADVRGRGIHPNLSHAVDINCEAAAHLKDSTC